MTTLNETPERADDVVSLDEANAFLQDKGAFNPCPMCGRTEWRGDVSPAVTGLLLVSGNSVVSLSGRFMRVDAYLFYCGNCGFLRPHIKQIVDEWVRSRRDGSAG